MRYRFNEIENGTIEEGYTSIQIINHEAEITDEAAILLAEKHGGELAPPQKASVTVGRRQQEVKNEGGTD